MINLDKGSRVVSVARYAAGEEEDELPEEGEAGETSQETSAEDTDSSSQPTDDGEE